jgi:hypothetical protein
MQSRLSLARLSREMNRSMAEIRRAAAALEKDGLVRLTVRFVTLR